MVARKVALKFMNWLAAVEQINDAEISEWYERKYGTAIFIRSGVNKQELWKKEIERRQLEMVRSHQCAVSDVIDMV